VFRRLDSGDTSANITSTDIVMVAFQSDSSTVGPGFTMHFEG